MSKNKFKVAHSELMDSTKTIEILKLVGREKYWDMLQKVSEKRYGDGSLEQLQEKVKNSSDEEYEKLKPILEKEQKKLVPMSKEAYIDVEMPNLYTNKHKWDQFTSIFGEDRFFKAIGMEGLETASKPALKRVNKRAEIYEDTKHKVQKKRDVVQENASGSTAQQQDKE